MKKTIIAAVLLGSLAFTGCEELENLCGINSDDLGFTEDFTQSLNAGIYIYQKADLALRDSLLNATGTATIDGALCTLTGDSIILDYKNGVTGDDGKVRSGSIRIGYVGDYMQPGSSAALVLKNYVESDKPYEASIQLSNMTTNPALPSVGVNVDYISADSLNFSANLLADWTSGFDTQNNDQDDAFELSGNATLENVQTTNQFLGTINSPLHIENQCEYTLVGGLISMIPDNPIYPEVTLDFVDGDCQNLFQATIDCEGNSLSFSYPIK